VRSAGRLYFCNRATPRAELLLARLAAASGRRSLYGGRRLYASPEVAFSFHPREQYPVRRHPMGSCRLGGHFLVRRSATAHPPAPAGSDRQAFRLFASGLCPRFCANSTSVFSSDSLLIASFARVLADALYGGRATIAPFGDFAGRPEILDAMRASPQALGTAAVGPDGYPDLAAGQVFPHPPGHDCIFDRSGCTDVYDAADSVASCR